MSKFRYFPTLLRYALWLLVTRRINWSTFQWAVRVLPTAICTRAGTHIIHPEIAKEFFGVDPD